MLKKPIEDLTELERRIIHHHITTYPHFATGLSTLGIFRDVHQDESDAAISKLVQYGYYKEPQHYSVFWTPDGYYRCQNYFKLNNIHSETESKESIHYPDKITLKWLYTHVPYRFWTYLLSLLFVAFILGTTLANTKLYKSLIDLITTNSNKTDSNPKNAK